MMSVFSVLNMRNPCNIFFLFAAFPDKYGMMCWVSLGSNEGQDNGMWSWNGHAIIVEVNLFGLCYSNCSLLLPCIIYGWKGMLEFSGDAQKILVWSLQLWKKMWGTEPALGGRFPALKKTFGCVADGIYPVECLEVESSLLLFFWLWLVVPWWVVLLLLGIFPCCKLGCLVGIKFSLTKKKKH